MRILRDAEENYAAWLDAIASARSFIHLENYFLEEDEVGTLFAERLMRKAAEGVVVRVIRDWLGCWRLASSGFWRRMTAAGVEVRCFNPPRFDSPVGWISRDHRKAIAVDGRIAFVAGLCISKRWKGNRDRLLPPWRDTGIEIVGPAVAEVHTAFGQVWETMGSPLPPGETPTPAAIASSGNVALRVIAGSPTTAGVLRTDQLVAAIARESLWLTDAYFVGITPYVQALLAAAKDGVDVRLLVPNASDIPVVRTLSRSGFRPLLEGGVRIFEWNGTMLHAKTAVVDGRWSRIGSSNLNVASFIGNYELDVAIDNLGVAQAMRAIYLDDLASSTEIVLSRNRVLDLHPANVLLGRRARRRGRRRRVLGQKSAVAAAGAIRVANAVQAAMTGRRLLGPAEDRLLVGSALFLLAVAVAGMLWPRLLSIPLALLAGYAALALLGRTYRLRRRIARASQGSPPPSQS